MLAFIRSNKCARSNYLDLCKFKKKYFKTLKNMIALWKTLFKLYTRGN